MITHALLRRPAPTVADGLTTADEGRPDPARTREQFEAYAAALRDAGVDATVLDPLPDHPDAHFVEDVAVVMPEVIVRTRPGAPERRGEIDAVGEALQRFGPVVDIEAPGTLDGGDVLTVGDRVFVGRSERTNDAGARQLRAIVEPQGFSCVTVPVGAGLHLKSSVNAVSDDTLVLTAEFAHEPAFAEFDRVVVPDGEEYAANVLRVNDRVLVPAGYPAMAGRLRARGLAVVELAMSEFRKMDGGLTCLSVRFGGGRR